MSGEVLKTKTNNKIIKTKHNIICEKCNKEAKISRIAKNNNKQTNNTTLFFWTEHL